LIADTGQLVWLKYKHYLESEDDNDVDTLTRHCEAAAPAAAAAAAWNKRAPVFSVAMTTTGHA